MISPDETTAPAQRLSDFAGRVLPESMYKLPGRLAAGAYQAVKGQTDPIVKGLTTEFNNPDYHIGSEMYGNAGRTLSGLAQAVVSPTGLLGIDKAKESWLSDPAGSALAITPMVKPTLRGLGKVAGKVTNIIPTPEKL